VQITLNLHKLVEYGNDVLLCPGELWALKSSMLEGGYAADGVHRHDLVFRLADGRLETVSVVQKYTSESEVQVMQALNEVPTAQAIPLVIDFAGDSSVSDESGTNWFITPLYEGAFLTFEDEVPTSVIESLARVHAYFASRVEQLDWLCHVDAGVFLHTLDRAMEGLIEAQSRRPHPALAAVRRDLELASEDPVPLTALGKLPVTLTHGDVHPGNIINLSDARSILIDWGNARIAPPMLDLANMVEIDSPNWTTYLSTWEAANGEAMDANIARLGYYWATVMINVQYLPYVASRWPEDTEAVAHVQSMGMRLLDAVKRMSESKIGEDTNDL
jgi:aminoglycoside phosphotransferase (APT) family kinase protein